MTKLRITHFHDPEPDPKQISLLSADHDNGQNEYEHYLTEWKARQVKPDWDGNFSFTEHSIGETPTKEYKKALQHYDENRRRYDGFEKMSRSLEKYSDGTLDITFGRNDYVHIKFDFEDSGLLNLEFYRGLSVSLFEQIMYENNIKIKKV